MKYLWMLIAVVVFLTGCRKDKIISGKSYVRTDPATGNIIFSFYIPTAFSPNGDNINEYWEPQSYGLDSSQYHVDILNKSGKIIFKSDAPAKFWGKETNTWLPTPQTLCYYIEAKDKSGNSYKFKGQFAIIK